VYQQTRQATGALSGKTVPLVSACSGTSKPHLTFLNSVSEDIDSALFVGVFHVDFPPNMVNMKQDSGQSGPHPEGLLLRTSTVL
jgi:hypothetical protein